MDPPAGVVGMEGGDGGKGKNFSLRPRLPQTHLKRRSTQGVAAAVHRAMASGRWKKSGGSRKLS